MTYIGRVPEIRYKAARVTPTITGVQYANNDILFDTTEIPNAVLYEGGASKLINMTITSKSTSLFDCIFYFWQVNQSMGTVNAARSISDATMAAGKCLGGIYMNADNLQNNYSNGRIYSINQGYSGFTGETKTYPQLPIVLQAEAGSKSVYVAAIVQSEDSSGNVTPSFSIGDIELIFGLEL